VTLSGFVVPLDWSPGVLDVFPINSYWPSLVEWGVAIGIVGYSWMGFTLGVRYLHLYPHSVDLPQAQSKLATESSPTETGEEVPVPAR
jgi:Ni/Fe-hydrogenase subunit HybB-like protein